MLRFPPHYHLISLREDFLRWTLAIGILSSLLAFSVVPSVYAAVSPSMGAASTYGILSSTFTNTTAGTTISGDIGFSTGPAVTPGGAHTHYGSVDPYFAAGSDQSTALSSLSSQPCTFSFPAGAINLSTDMMHGPVGVYTPGVYCSTGAINIGGPLTLNGNGTYIFRSGGALTSTAGATVSLIGASACDVFWTPTQAVTLGANTVFAGTVIDNAGITVGANTVWNGRALAFGGTVTVDTLSMTVCSAAASSSSSSLSSSLSSSSSSSSFSSSSSSSLSSSISSSSSSSSLRSSVSSSRSSSFSSSSSVLASSSSSSSPFFLSFSPSSSSSTHSVLPPDPLPLPPPPPALAVFPQTGIDLGTSVLAGLGLILATFFLLVTEQRKRFLSA